MPNRFIPGMRAALFDSDLVASRLALALAELLWAVMLIWPGDTFQRPTYSLMRQIAPESAWAAMFLITSVLQYGIVALGLYGSVFAHLFAAWNSTLWVTTIGAMLLSIYPPPAAIAGEIALTVSALWICVRPVIIRRGERLHAAD